MSRPFYAWPQWITLPICLPRWQVFSFMFSFFLFSQSTSSIFVRFVSNVDSFLKYWCSFFNNIYALKKKMIKKKFFSISSICLQYVSGCLLHFLCKLYLHFTFSFLYYCICIKMLYFLKNCGRCVPYFFTSFFIMADCKKEKPDQHVFHDGRCLL